VEFDSRAIGPGGLFLALPGARSMGTTTRSLRWGPARSPCWRRAPSACRHLGNSATPSASDIRAGVLEHDADGSGAAVLAALAKLARAVAPNWVAGGLTIVGITGSSGKTSTKDLVAAVLQPLGEVVAPPGSFNNELGHPGRCCRPTRSTNYLILEMSARHPGNIAALADIARRRSGWSSCRHRASGEFGSREAIAKTKSELPPAVPAIRRVVILNVDVPGGGRHGRG